MNHNRMRFSTLFVMCCYMFVGLSCKHIAEITFVEPENPATIKITDRITFDVKKIMDLKSHSKSSYNQSMSVFENKAFVFYTGGYCKIIDLKDKKELREVTLASYAQNNHVNNAMFSKFFYQEGDKYPLLYISPYAKQTCYVERYHENENTFELIQTIDVSTSLYYNEYGEFVLDEDNGLLYDITFPSTNANNSHIKIFHIPPFSNNHITLTDNDLLGIKSIELIYNNILQGALYNDGYIYLLFGNQNTRKQLYIVNTQDFTYYTIDYTDFFGRGEPEDISFYKDTVITCSNYPSAMWNLFTIK